MRLKGKIRHSNSYLKSLVGKIEHTNEYTGSIRQVISRLHTLTAKIEFTDIILAVLGAARKILTKSKANLSILRTKRIISESNEVRGVKEAKVSVYPPKYIAVNREIKAGKNALLSWITVASLNVNHPVKGAITAKLVALYRAAMYYSRKIRILISAPLESAKGTVTEVTKKVRIQYDSPADVAEGKTVESIGNIPFEVTASGITAETNAATVEKDENPAVDAPAVAADSSVAVFCVAPKVNHTAKPAMWADPVLIDGELYIRSAYSATQTDTILEVT